jgi:hypothetical protein
MVYEAPSLEGYVVAAVDVVVFCLVWHISRWLWARLVAAYWWVYERREMAQMVFIFGFIAVVLIACAKGW